MAMIIRPADLEDLNHLDAVEKSIFDTRHYPQTSKKHFRYLLTKGNVDIRVATVMDQIVGLTVLFYRKNAHFGRLYSIGVLSQYQGGAIGKALFDDAEKCIREKNLKGMTLEIRSDNQRHLIRYQHLGYTLTQEIDDYYPDGQSCFKLKKVF